MKQAETQKSGAQSAVAARLPEAYQWLLVPTQKDASSPLHWEAIRLSGTDALALRASKKLKSDDHLITTFAASSLRLELDRVPLWRRDSAPVRQLVDDFARYLYLPRLAGPDVLLEAIRGGVALLTGEQDGFAYAESYDEGSQRYRGLRAAQLLSLPDTDAPGIVVKLDVARKQLDAETGVRPEAAGVEPTPEGGAEPHPTSQPGGAPSLPEAGKATRFHGTVVLDAARTGRDASRIADEIIAHLAGLVGANVKVTLEIEADFPGGAPDHVVRTVTENGRTLKFTSQGFEKE